jgi:hypothetical protein
MGLGHTIRMLLLGVTLGTAWPVIVHWDAYQIEHRPGDFIDPSTKEPFKEHTLEKEFLRFAGMGFITFWFFAVHWSRKRPGTDIPQEAGSPVLFNGPAGSPA